MSRHGIGAALLFGMFFAHAQTLIIPQIADGGGWQTTLVLTNTTANSQPASLSFFQETSGGATQSWNLPFLEGSSTQTISLAGGGTIFLHSVGAAPTTSVGWAQVQAPAGVVCYAIFTAHNPGRSDQDGTAPAATGATRILVPFDNTNGFVTSMAIANPTSQSESVTVGIRTAAGTVTQPTPLTIPAQGHMAFAFPQQLAATSGQSGLAEFYSPSGSIAVLALRFNPAGSFTAAPVYSQSGPPIIGSGGPTGGGTLPNFRLITIYASPSPNGQPQLGISTILLESTSVIPDGSYVAVVGGQYYPNFPIPPIISYTASWNSVSGNGQMFTYNGVDVAHSTMSSLGGITAFINSGSLTVTLTPGASNAAGTVTGSLNLVSSLATVSGSFTGTYAAQ